MGFLSPDEASPKIMEASEKALELDSTLAEVYYMMAITKEWYQWDWSGAEPYFLNAIAANPNYGDPRAYYSQYLIHLGRPDEAMEQVERALELDPISTLFQSLNGWSLLMLRRYDEAVEQFQAILDLEPNHLIALDGLWDTYNKKKMYPEALEMAKALYVAMGEPDVISAFDEGFEENGYRGAMLRAAELLAGRADSIYSPAYDVARLYVNAGRNRAALEWLERGVDEHNPDMPYVGQPLWDPLRGEPRYKDVLRRMNLPE